MGKTKKSFRSDEYFDDEDESGRGMHSEKHQRYANRIIEQALKSKDVEAFISEDDSILDAIDEGFEEGWTTEEESYVACIECGKVLITEDDFKGSSEFYDDINETKEYICSYCLKHDVDK